MRCRYIHITGPEKELPKGDGTYATHIPLLQALDESMEVIVAYKQNGQFLHPDHGFPVRCIIPGWIAGRMVKWLCEIKVTDEECDNYYHHYDNKVRLQEFAKPLPEGRMLASLLMPLQLHFHADHRQYCEVHIPMLFSSAKGPHAATER
jgi:DMSO/TMAO reductase YedYZ molybdopterin-dependent catalytic subunit